VTNAAIAKESGVDSDGCLGGGCDSMEAGYASAVGKRYHVTTSGAR
jgi:hypothetical protein